MEKTLAEIGEFGLIHRIHELLEREGIQSPYVTLGIGDDSASFLPREGHELLITCDCMVEGRHYLPKHTTPLDMGSRAMVINISDIGAMGGKPLYALVSLGLKENTLVADVEEMYRGFIMELKQFGASIIGGNITKVDYSNFIDITLVGEAESGMTMRRSTAKAGDAVLVTGYPGRAAAGLYLLLNSEDSTDLRDHPLVKAYNRPEHRAKEGRAMARSGYATSMIDISDGLLGDLGHICEESGLGAELFQERLPISREIQDIMPLADLEAYEIVLNDSDDYELIITCLPENVEKVCSVVGSVSDIAVTQIGSITTPSEGIRLIFDDGTWSEVTPTGWDHFKRR